MLDRQSEQGIPIPPSFEDLFAHSPIHHSNLSFAPHGPIEEMSIPAPPDLDDLLLDMAEAPSKRPIIVNKKVTATSDNDREIGQESNGNKLQSQSKAQIPTIKQNNMFNIADISKVKLRSAKDAVLSERSNSLMNANTATTTSSLKANTTPLKSLQSHVGSHLVTSQQLLSVKLRSKNTPKVSKDASSTAINDENAKSASALQNIFNSANSSSNNAAFVDFSQISKLKLKKSALERSPGGTPQKRSKTLEAATPFVPTMETVLEKLKKKFHSPSSSFKQHKPVENSIPFGEEFDAGTDAFPAEATNEKKSNSKRKSSSTSIISPMRA
jgi:hypothetical protein